jgi:uncharacterized protein (DUF2141 family)
MACRMPMFLRLYLPPVLMFFLAVAAGQAAPADGRTCNPGDAVRLQITVAGVRAAKGNITLMLYGDSEEKFLKKGGRLARIRVPAAAGELRVCIPAPVPGSYAVSLYHDEDANKKLTKNWLGLPTEGYGFSRDAPVSYRLPELDETVFTALPGDTSVHITVRY